MFRLLAIFSVVASMMTSSVLANPTFPGTCFVAAMAAPHGTTPATDASYALNVKQTAKTATGNTYSMTIDGTGTFTGLLLYATDAATKARFGSFIKIPNGYAPYTPCKGENPKTNTLGHNSPAPKKLPVTFTWTDAGHNAGKAWKGSFTGIVMLSEMTTWYVIPSTAVTSGSIGGDNATATAKTTATASAVTPSAVVVSSSDASGTNNASGTSDPSGSSNPTPLTSSSPGGTSTDSSSAARLDASFVLCLLLSAFALVVRL